jgi:uncharacterized protein (TIGR03435 family)
MNNSTRQGLHRLKQTLAASAGVAALVASLAIGIGHPRTMRAQSRVMTAAAPQLDSGGVSSGRPLQFDSASVKPFRGGGGGRAGSAVVGPPRAANGALRFMPGKVVSAPTAGVTAGKIILEAFHLTESQLSGGPSWLGSARFDLEARAEGANDNQLRQMLQTLLADRFKLVVHRETKVMPVYALVVAKNGPKFHEWKEGDPLPAFGSGGHPNNFRDRGTMQRLADVIAGDPMVDQPVLDKTGLNGVYAFYFEWDDGEDFLHALQDQLGLKLERQKAPLDHLIIERIEMPEAN